MNDFHSSPAPIDLWVDDHRPIGRGATHVPDRFVDLVADARPRLSWIVPLVRDGQAQTAYEIKIATGDLDPRSRDTQSTWTTGVVESTESSYLRPSLEMKPHSWHRWTVRTRDELGAWSPWADPAVIEAGPLTATDWNAEWITTASTRSLVGTIQLPVAPVRARLHITAQGVYRASVGGVVVNPGTAEPSRTDPVRALYRTYDITDLLADGAADLEVDLGASHWAESGLDPRLLAEVVAVLPDGAVHRVGTGPSWVSRPSQVILEEAFYVERHDGRRTGTADARSVTALGHPGECREEVPLLPRRIEPDPSPPIRTVAEQTAKEVARPREGSRVYDVGTNIAGRTRLSLGRILPAGTELVIVHGEILDADGAVDTTNIKMGYDTDRHRQVVTYVAAGVPGEVVEPWFAFHGFRYVEVSGLPEDAEAELTALTMHTDTPVTATFDCDDAALRRLVAAASRTQLNNFHGMPEDCPTREQAGWTGDAAATTDLALAHLDVAGFYRKWLGDLTTSQRDDGGVPSVAPGLRPESTPPDPVWGAAVQRVLIGHWLHYGDQSLVTEFLPTLRRWADYQLTRVRDGAVRDAPVSWGHDWLGLEQTPPELLHTGAALDALDSLADLELALGNDTEWTCRRDQAASLRRSARLTFHDPDRGTWGNGSQGSKAVALSARLVEPAEVAHVAAAVATAVRSRGTRVSTGYAATAPLVRALAAAGHSQVIADVVHQPAQPGVGAMLVDGPGTLWEAWWIDPTSTGTGSLDHIGLGGPFAAWAWTTLVGLRPTAPGFRSFAVVPNPVDGVGHATSVTSTVQGTVRAGWRREGDEFAVDVEVPVGARATVHVPGAEPVEVGAGRHHLRAAWPDPVAVPPVETPPFTTPVRAPVAADVAGGESWLRAAVAADRLSPTVDVTRVDVLDDGIVCMPVPHAQVPGPVVRLTGSTEGSPCTPHLLRLDLDVPHDLTTATFVYALLDVCLPVPPGHPLHLVLRVVAADGSTREASTRYWMCGWSRVALDVADWPERAAVAAIEVGVRCTAAPGPSGDTRHGPETNTVPVSFHLGEVGWSAARRTW